LVMATRSGTVDPGLVLWLEEHAGMPPAEVASALEHRSGLLGLAGTPALEAVLHSEADGDADAALAVAVYIHRLRTAIGAMTTALSGLDVLIFTGGVGEHAAPIRHRATSGLDFLGVSVEMALNDAASGDAVISSPEAVVTTLVIEAREDLEIVAEMRSILE